MNGDRPDPRFRPYEWLAWAYQIFSSPRCDGCTACSDKCAGAFTMWYEEFEQIRRALRDAGVSPPAVPEGDEWTRCPMLDPASRLCIIYPVRPLICRAFGLVPWLPCPSGRAEPVDAEVAERVMSEYASRPRKTYWRWLSET